MKTCTSEEFKKALEAHEPDTYFLDARTPEEYDEGHIEGVRNTPLGCQWSPEDIEKFKNGKVYAHCKKGGRAAQCCQILEELGVQNLYNLEGGIDAWEEAGLPVVKS